MAGPNGLDVLRLGLAWAVLFAHSWPLTGHGAGAVIGAASLGTVAEIAVAGFFTISGYLITGSRLRLSAARFAWARFLRIFPGYWAMLFVVAFMLAPAVSLAAGEHWTFRAGAHYVRANWTTNLHDFAIRGTLTDTPYLPAWNGSAWTLWFELLCYVAAGVGLACMRGRWRLPSAVVAAGALCAANLVTGNLDGQPRLLLHLGAWFAAGSVLRLAADRIPLRGDVAASAAVVAAGSCFAGELDSIGAFPLAYLALWAGVKLTARPPADLSYGVYIYAFPIQQSLANLGMRSPWLMAAAATALVVPVAFASWRLVEHPALRAKGWTPRLPVTASHTAP